MRLFQSGSRWYNDIYGNCDNNNNNNNHLRDSKVESSSTTNGYFKNKALKKIICSSAVRLYCRIATNPVKNAFTNLKLICTTE